MPAGEWPGGISPPGFLLSGHEPLDSPGSHRSAFPLSVHEHSGRTRVATSATTCRHTSSWRVSGHRLRAGPYRAVLEPLPAQTAAKAHVQAIAAHPADARMLT